MFSGLLVQSTFINIRFQLQLLDLDLYLNFSIQIMGILMSGVLIQNNASFREKPRTVRLEAVPLHRLKENKNKPNNNKTPPQTNKPPTNQQNPKPTRAISGLEYLIVGWQT